jgi:hypothetical protein
MAAAASGTHGAHGERTAAPFDLRVSLPSDERFASTLDTVVVFAAQASGCSPGAAERFGKAVALAVGEYRAAHASAPQIPVVLSRRAGTLEVMVGDRTMTPQP